MSVWYYNGGATASGFDSVGDGSGTDATGAVLSGDTLDANGYSGARLTSAVVGSDVTPLAFANTGGGSGSFSWQVSAQPSVVLAYNFLAPTGVGATFGIDFIPGSQLVGGANLSGATIVISGGAQVDVIPSGAVAGTTASGGGGDLTTVSWDDTTGLGSFSVPYALGSSIVTTLDATSTTSLSQFISGKPVTLQGTWIQSGSAGFNGVLDVGATYNANGFGFQTGSLSILGTLTSSVSYTGGASTTVGSTGTLVIAPGSTYDAVPTVNAGGILQIALVTAVATSDTSITVASQYQFPAGNLLVQYSRHGLNAWVDADTQPTYAGGVYSLPITGLTPNTEHDFQVSWDGGSTFPATVSTTDTVVLSAPGTFTATAVSASEVDLSWAAVVQAGATIQYLVYRSLGVSGGMVLLATVTSGTSYADTGLWSSPSAGLPCYYQIVAHDSGGNFSDSSPAAANATTDTASGGGGSGGGSVIGSSIIQGVR